MSATPSSDDLHDLPADETIQQCLDLDAPRSFFLYAGAGSGKTRSLVEAIKKLRMKDGRRLSLSGRKVGVITYTNAACDEIKRRLDYDARIEVSTIHAFAWSLIGGHNSDIREWLRGNLKVEIGSLTEEHARGRAGTKAHQDRERSLESKSRRLAGLDDIRKFVYSPTGDNREREALNHSEVISITSAFLRGKNALQKLLVAKYPILLVDESQDTNRHLMDALLAVQAGNEEHFCLGLLGDTMQRIYSDGKVDLAQSLPPTWARPIKEMNHRCPQRVIRLINRMRAEVDDQAQRGRTDAIEGHVRLFVLPESTLNKLELEDQIAHRMASLTGDVDWNPAKRTYKTLTLEHHMAAVRFGFAAMFAPLYRNDRLNTGLLEGSLAGTRFFSQDILPVVRALKASDAYALAAAVRNRSPLVSAKNLKAEGADQMALLQQANTACHDLFELFKDGNEPNFRAVLQHVAQSGLFTVPEALQPFVSVDQDFTVDIPPEFAAGLAELDDSERGAWREMLDTEFSQIEAYDAYVSGASPFGTHQGVKGLEFPRVMVVISDSEARGFMFSYEKLFGVKEKSTTDLKNEQAGTETTIDRTRRLFYVTCSRAQKSLAVVSYTDNPSALRDLVVSREWFAAEEVELLG